MSHRYRKQVPSTRAYRHFAVVTLALTVLLAVFAEGEKAEAVTHRAEQQQPSGPEPAATSAMQQPGGLWGSDEGGSFGPAIGGASLREAASSWWPVLSSRGYSPDYIARLSEEERVALEAAIAENADAGRSSVARLEAASRARSGSVGRE